MSKGRGHRKFNFFIGGICGGILLGGGLHYFVALSFIAGFFIATTIFSPDLDITAGKNKAIRLILYPYSIFFKHRGISHSILFGTITRIFYIILAASLLILICDKMNLIEITIGNYTTLLFRFFAHFNYDQLPYKMLTWLYIGMFLADFCHIFLDTLSTKLKRLWSRF